MAGAGIKHHEKGKAQPNTAGEITSPSENHCPKYEY